MKKESGLPMRLKIPEIMVDAPIEYVGLTPDGVMESPTSAANGGWFNRGPRPGEIGSAVIAGHFNTEIGSPGVFMNLHKLKHGDKLYVEDDRGGSSVFVVRESRVYDPGYADDVFGRNDMAHLNLITCDGVWDEIERSYSKRLVVFADVLD